MKENETALTEKDFQEFLSATGEEQWKILLAHAEKNDATIKMKKLKAAESSKQYEVKGKNQRKTQSK